MPYLIDGHNLIGAMRDIRLSDPNDEMKLVNKLRSYAARKGKKLTVIFDGGLPGGKSIASNDKVTVIFAAYEHSSADKLIAARIKRLRDPQGWTLVTSDQELLGLAKSYRVRAIRSAAFADTLAHLPDPPDLGEWIYPITSPSETAYWEERMTAKPPPAPPQETIQPPAAAEPPPPPKPKPAPAVPPAPKPKPARPQDGDHKSLMKNTADEKPLMKNTVDEWLRLFGADDEKP
jgi:hypothetical protein